MDRKVGGQTAEKKLRLPVSQAMVTHSRSVHTGKKNHLSANPRRTSFVSGMI